MWLPLRSFTRPLSSAPRGPLIRRLAAVDSLQRRYTALEEETIRKQRALQLQLREAAAELQVRRQEIVSGSAEPTDAEVTSSDAFFSGREPDEPEDLAGAVGIPGFWKGVLGGADLHVNEEPAVSERDWEVLESLEEVRVEPWSTPGGEGDNDEMVAAAAAATGEEEAQEVPAGGHLLTFCFGPNRFFEPGAALLSSELLAHSLDGAGSVGPDGSAVLRLYCTEEGDVVGAAAAPFCEGRDPRSKVMVRKRKGKGKAGGERQRLVRPVASFFRLFEPPARWDGDEMDDYFGAEGGGGGEAAAAARGGPGAEDEVPSSDDYHAHLALLLAEEVVPNAGAFYMRSIGAADAEEEFDGAFSDFDDDYDAGGGSALALPQPKRRLASSGQS